MVEFVLAVDFSYLHETLAKNAHVFNFNLLRFFKPISNPHFPIQISTPIPIQIPTPYKPDPKLSQKHKISCGIHIVTPDTEILDNRIKDGYRFIAYSIDSVFLRTSASIEGKLS